MLYVLICLLVINICKFFLKSQTDGHRLYRNALQLAAPNIKLALFLFAPPLGILQQRHLRGAAVNRERTFLGPISM